VRFVGNAGSTGTLELDEVGLLAIYIAMQVVLLLPSLLVAVGSVARGAWTLCRRTYRRDRGKRNSSVHTWLGSRHDRYYQQCPMPLRPAVQFSILALIAAALIVATAREPTLAILGTSVGVAALILFGGMHLAKLVIIQRFKSRADFGTEATVRLSDAGVASHGAHSEGKWAWAAFPGLSEILCVSRLMNLLAQHESIAELDSQLRFGSMP
jgi:hypothetical protein